MLVKGATGGWSAITTMKLERELAITVEKNINSIWTYWSLCEVRITILFYYGCSMALYLILWWLTNLVAYAGYTTVHQMTTPPTHWRYPGRQGDWAGGAPLYVAVIYATYDGRVIGYCNHKARIGTCGYYGEKHVDILVTVWCVKLQY